jgi:Fur family transcriptional regulator, zinc uptake regulator
MAGIYLGLPGCATVRGARKAYTILALDWKVAAKISILPRDLPGRRVMRLQVWVVEMPEVMTKKPTKRRSAADQDKIIVEALRGVGRPVSAYELIEQVRAQGVSAPPTVYRALQRLIDDGLAHRLESLNAFVACDHPHHSGKAVFAICDACGTVKEFDSPTAVKSLQTWAGKNDFHIRSMTMEIRGRCGDCTAALD